MKRTITGDEVVTLEQAKEHIQGLEGIDTFDDYIESLIIAARELAEEFTWRCITESNFELRLDSIPSQVKLPKPPTIEIVEVQYLNSDGETTIMPDTDYELVNWIEPAILYFKSQPSTNNQKGNVKITFKAGFENTPKAIVQAMLMIIRTLYDNREDINNRNISELPITSLHLLKPYRCNEF